MAPKKSTDSWTKIIFDSVRRFIRAARSFFFAFIYPKVIELSMREDFVMAKREVFADIDSVTPSDKRNGQIKILEIGVGPGFNLPFYPKNCTLIALDKNPYFKSILTQKLKKHPGITLEKFVNECAEDMTSIPANSVDVVISSCVHCSVDDNFKVFEEIQRVLVPGGRYYFFEHILDEPHTTRYKWQTFFNKTGLWQLMWHGCVFTDFESKISKCEHFKYKGKLYRVFNDKNNWTYYITYPVVPHFGGCAIIEKT
ncbi:Thiol S-methyltransferase METTL7B [Pseudolycoriella hygida]|uniref:Thiol S-methyltransferase METTL7B n=1 Tax=Pseudolycoriella hygida TaxID=35572 RepID=A0A9Q0N9Z6_9DIPT|nr:Thiol S-methyltransferase METTL7B [Pseudolycoriella hygida]